ncbi:hypothetical protein CON65_08570 [Bacillus pseudomycoides]|uniref:Lipoprotein n=1 Tax=Bacillus pseudomycoides TaxID=64104 RepID=A0AA91VDV4_9BACI|nr:MULTISPECIES: hypothetical protein [Bacillus]PEB54812.1 hypothetical protein COO03_04225 [Bacillus sp. AFS098217]PED83227.1 hypothetical protein CON65_08570 [Bacillus pseudomycoides]PEU14080.1 hypothetical protein CN524_10980 [Bacillus sp. AFS019443]PEU17602.1 hypothetical protein CN525_13980 [Bacillus sp. AFS014408]PFW62288.1 hypothetical protein COL20_13455 [Bacillus sp. AFS075034]
MKNLKGSTGKILLASSLAFSMSACSFGDKEKTNAESSKQENNNNNNGNSNNSNSNNNNNGNSNNNNNGNNNNDNSNNSNSNNNNNGNSNNNSNNNNGNSNNGNSNNSNSNNNNNGNGNSNNNNNSNNNSNNNQQQSNQNQGKPANSVTLEQHGVIVTVHTIEQAEDIVRVKYTVNNTTDIPVSAGAPGAKIEQNGKSTMPTSFKGNWDQRGIVAPHTSVDGTNLYTLPNIPNEFDFKITPTFQDDSKINLIQPFILRVKMK